MTFQDAKHKRSVIIRTALITAVCAVLATLGVVHVTGGLKPDQHVHVTDADTEKIIGGGEEKTLYTCGMHPWIIAEEPGNCPICGMALTPKRDASAATENELISGVEVTVDPVTRQNMGVRTAKVVKGPLHHTIRTYGHITYDETRTGQISPKYNGWFEKLHADFTGQVVRKGDPLFDIYSPELLAAQEEYLGALRRLKRSPGGGGNDLLASARRRLMYFDVGEDEIREMEASGEVKKTLTIRSPFTGVVTHKNAVEGGYVKAGTTIYTISDLSTVWVEAHIYEYELSRVRPGLSAGMTLPYLPGKVYSGKVAYVYPYLQRQTRDVVIRLEFENPHMDLKPDMYGDVSIETVTDGEGLIIPTESVIRSGERNVVFIAREGGKFTPREVTLGIALDGGNIRILQGLAPGETVVTSGQFLLDSESKLKEAVQKMMAAKSAPAEEQEGAADGFFNDMEGEDDFFDDMETEDDFFKDME